MPDEIGQEFFDDITSIPWPADEPAPTTNGRDRARPDTIQVLPGELHNLATEGEVAIIESGMAVFQRGREIVRPVQQEVPASNGRMTVSAGVANVQVAGMVDLLGRATDWVRFDEKKKKLVPVDPSDRIARQILSRWGEWKFNPIVAVTTTPTLRPDGSLLLRSGYDPTTRFYFMPDPNVEPGRVPDNPTKDDAAQAIELLNRLIDEFPFVDDASRAVALSGLMTPLLRGAIPLAPLHAARASTAGTGKSYLWDVASTIASGRPCPVCTMSASPEETEAVIDGLLLAGRPIINLDNVNGELGGAKLNQAVERPTVEVRRKGASDIFEIESRATWYATGNNIRIKGDMTRRVIVCGLDRQMERPELFDFQRRPVDDILADRGRYIAAVLTIARAYIVAGRPGRLTPLASYEAWSDLVRSALVWLGMPDPTATMETAREDDPDLEALRAILGVWSRTFGDQPQTTRAVVDRALLRTQDDFGNPGGLACPELYDAIAEVATIRGKIDPKTFGKWVARNKGRIVGNLRIVKRDDTRTKVATWTVE